MRSAAKARNCRTCLTREQQSQLYAGAAAMQHIKDIRAPPQPPPLPPAPCLCYACPTPQHTRTRAPGLLLVALQAKPLPSHSQSVQLPVQLPVHLLPSATPKGKIRIQCNRGGGCSMGCRPIPVHDRVARPPKTEPKARWPKKAGGSQVRANKTTQPDGSVH
jgi:hypothetical protein